ncbi:MAG TPA: FUSC family protein [Jatrophihabitantaceae bacterium]|jgi:uncharacterized membrane protein YccC|nr:FUSC family protein [Jatrophihabitantaceae bacterium]
MDIGNLGNNPDGLAVKTPTLLRSVTDRLTVSDPGWGRSRMGWRMVVSLVVSFATGYGVALGLGQSTVLGMTAGAVLALVSSLVVPDAPFGQVARSLGWLVIPNALGLIVGLWLAPHRAMGLTLVVLAVFLQFYLDRFGHYGQQFGVMLGAAYLNGLLLPITVHVYLRFIVIIAAAAVACILARGVLCRYSPAWDLRQARRSFQATCRRAAASAAGVLQGPTGSGRAARQLRRNLDRVNTAALVFDGRLSPARVEGSIAEHLHRRVFDVEHALVSLADICQALAGEDAPVASAVVAAQLTALAAGHAADPAAIRAATAGTTARVRELLEQAADELDSYQTSNRIFSGDVSLAIENHVMFTGVVALEGARPAGARPLARRAAATAPRTWLRIPRPIPTTTKAIQAAIAAAIAIPLGDWFDPQHYYWAAIGVMIIMAGSTPHDQGRKVLRRAVGTIVGAVIGVAIHDLIGHSSGWWTLLVIVVALAIGAAAISEIYPIWVAGLVVALAQVYSLEGGSLDTLLAHRLAENVLGAAIAAVVSLLVLPISTRAAIRVGLHSYLKALNAFAVNLGQYLTGLDPNVRLRSDARALDHTLFQTRQVSSHLLRSPGPGPAGERELLSRLEPRHDRLDELIDSLSTATRQIKSLARHAPEQRSHTVAVDNSINQIIATLTTSVAALDRQLDSPGNDHWTSCGPLIHQLLNQLTGEDADLAPTLSTLEELDSCLTAAATNLGLTAINNHHDHEDHKTHETHPTQPSIAP